jgi:hypothetical protein
MAEEEKGASGERGRPGRGQLRRGIKEYRGGAPNL